MSRPSLRGAVLLLALSALPAGLAAQRPDSATVVPGEQYRGGPARELLLGRDYRSTWATPIRVEVLDLRRFAGGLTPVRRGGGNQTLSLRLMGADGREYAFRSVDKDHTRALPPDYRNTLVDAVIQDQVSSLHPGGPLVADALLTAAGVLHVGPLLRVMPDDPALGEFRKDFAGMLGYIEERADERERPEDADKDEKSAEAEEKEAEEEAAKKAEEDDDNDDDDQGDPEQESPPRTAPTWGGADRIVNTEKFFEELEEGPRNRFDDRDYLRGRLMDLLFGDWDRHEDQYRWARFDRGGVRVWRALPRDRDYVFVDYDGALLRAANRIYPKAVLYGPTYPKTLYGLTINAQHLDRRLLSGLTRAAFDSVAADLQARLSDGVIDAALRRMPPQHHALTAADLGASIRRRRDGLREVAGRLYEWLNREAEVHTTDLDERAEVVRLADGSVEVRVSELRGGRAAGTPFFVRRYLPGETREIRLDLHGGDDHAVVSGAAERSILVRVIGGGGDDTLENRSRVPGTRTAFYDSRGDNRFVAGGGTKVDERRYDEPEHERGNLQDPPRDWGETRSLFAPSASWRANVGPVIGGGPAVTRYGFRRHPFASSWRLQGVYAPLYNRFGVEYTGTFHRVGSTAMLGVLARASDMEVTRFHGFGNETDDVGDGDRYKVWHTVVRAEPLWSLEERNDLTLSLGPVLRYYDPETKGGTPLAATTPRGSDPFLEMGAQGWAVLDRRDSESFPRRGLRARAGGLAFPVGWEMDGPFGRTEAEVDGYLSLPGDRGPVLALRAGGVRAWGDYPFQEAAFLGGSHSLRGHSFQRFAGDAAVYGGAEVRAPLVYTNLGVRGWLGVTGLADAGRVFLDGESSDRWHSTLGAGAWFAMLDRTRVLGVTYARGEKNRVYFHLGFQF